MKLLFVSNLFPDSREPIRGLDNACLLHYLREHFDEVRAIGIRPKLWGGGGYRPREEDRTLNPVYCTARYIPKIGSRWNHKLMASALEKSMRRLHGEFPYDVVLGSWLVPRWLRSSFHLKENGLSVRVDLSGL